MKKSSIAPLQERLTAWIDWDGAIYELGACLGFWSEFGAPSGEDQWNGAKGTIWSSNPLGDAMSAFLDGLVEEGCLEQRNEPSLQFRWKPGYMGDADMISTLGDE
jgi:hypothetical protein